MTDLKRITPEIKLHGNEKAYPIYAVSCKHLQPVSADPLPFQLVGAPEGMEWNVHHFHPQLVRDQAEFDAHVLSLQTDWWSKNRREGYGDPIWLVKQTGEEVWCCTWFSHYTFDVGMNDIEVLASFERYIERTVRRSYAEGKPEIKGALMCAEDRWRWKGGADPNADPTPPPCRCEHCKKQGIVRINH